MTNKERIHVQWLKREEQYAQLVKLANWTNPSFDYICQLVYKDYYCRLQFWLGKEVLPYETWLNSPVNN
jgi:hypothetical protein